MERTQSTVHCVLCAASNEVCSLRMCVWILLAQLPSSVLWISVAVVSPAGCIYTRFLPRSSLALWLFFVCLFRLHILSFLRCNVFVEHVLCAGVCWLKACCSVPWLQWVCPLIDHRTLDLWISAPLFSLIFFFFFSLCLSSSYCSKYSLFSTSYTQLPHKHTMDQFHPAPYIYFGQMWSIKTCSVLLPSSSRPKPSSYRDELFRARRLLRSHRLKRAIWLFRDK